MQCIAAGWKLNIVLWGTLDLMTGKPRRNNLPNAKMAQVKGTKTSANNKKRFATATTTLHNSKVGVNADVALESNNKWGPNIDLDLESVHHAIEMSTIPKARKILENRKSTKTREIHNTWKQKQATHKGFASVCSSWPQVRNLFLKRLIGTTQDNLRHAMLCLFGASKVLRPVKTVCFSQFGAESLNHAASPTVKQGKSTIVKLICVESDVHDVCVGTSNLEMHHGTKKDRDVEMICVESDANADADADAYAGNSVTLHKTVHNGTETDGEVAEICNADDDDDDTKVNTSDLGMVHKAVNAIMRKAMSLLPEPKQGRKFILVELLGEATPTSHKSSVKQTPVSPTTCARRASDPAANA